MGHLGLDRLALEFELGEAPIDRNSPPGIKEGDGAVS